MSDPAPALLDPWQLVESGDSLRVEIPLADMPRLQSLLCDSDGQAVVELTGCRDQQGRALIRGRVSTSVRVICQRCMEPMVVPLDVPIELGLIDQESGSVLLPRDYEPLVVANGDRVVLAELVADELILAMPTVARHVGGASCKMDDGSGTGVDDSARHPLPEAAQRQRPFADLRALLKRANTDQQE